MDRKFIKFIATFILVSMSLTLITSCDNVRKRKKTADQVVIENTYKFCDAILDYNADVITKLSLDDNSEEPITRKLKYYYSNPSWDSYDKKIADTILESMTYRVDKYSVLASYEKEVGTIDVVFSFVDYKKCKAENSTSTKKALYDLLQDYEDTTYVIIPFNYVYDDEGEWVVDDFEKIFIDLFKWREYDFSAVFDLKANLEKIEINDYDGRIGSTTDFVNISEFSVDCFVTKDDDDWVSCYFVLYHEGDEYQRSALYDSSIAYFFDVSGKGDYFAIFSAADRNEYYFPSGNYEVVLYDLAGNELDSLSFTNTYDQSNQSFVYGDSYAVEDIDSISWAYSFDGERFKLVMDMYSIYTGFDTYFTIEDIDGNICYESDTYTLGTVAHKLTLDVELDDFEQPSGRLYLNWYDSNDDLIVKAILVD